MFKHEKMLFHPVEVERPNPQYAVLLQEQWGTIHMIPGEKGAAENESGLSILFQKENYDILITGDRGGFGERILLKSGQLPDLEVLVAGHHGARESTCEELLRATIHHVDKGRQ